MKKRIFSVLLMIFILLSMAACTVPQGGAAPGWQPQKAENTLLGGRKSFALQQMLACDETLTPAVPEYTVAEDFSNITNYEYGYYDRYPEDFQQRLLKNGFVVKKGWNDEFYSVYEFNRYSQTPNFVTTDSMMHTYHLYFNHLLKDAETDYLFDEVCTMSLKMQRESAAQYEALKGTEWEEAALNNWAFFSVAAALTDPSAPVPAEVAATVNAELALIDAAGGITESPLMKMQEDYSQYTVRGYYTQSEKLSAYFRTMMWYGRITFLQSETTHNRSALLMTLALENSGAVTEWEKVYTVTSFFVGASDDLGAYDYAAAVKKAYKKWPSAEQLPQNSKAFDAFCSEIAKLSPPQINSLPIGDESIDPDKEAVTKGYRFMGQRFTLDASVFQQLIYREVKENAQGERRMLPSALDVPAALGSEKAMQILHAQGADEYAGYTQNMATLQAAMQNAPDTLWNASLYAGWLNTITPMLAPKGDGYPQFMQNDAWTAKNLSSFLGSWTELKHDTVLYSKQVYAEMGGGPMEEIDDRGYVEPEPVVYARLACLARSTANGLDTMGMLTDAARENLNRLAELAEQLMTISEKELRNETLTDEEYELILAYGGQLEHFWYEAVSDGSGEINDNDLSAAVITDVATNPAGSVLQVGVGRPDIIYVVVNVDGKLRVAEGAVFSYYEFEQPLENRLTDEEWRTMLGINTDWVANRPEVQRPAWVREFYLD